MSFDLSIWETLFKSEPVRGEIVTGYRLCQLEDDRAAGAVGLFGVGVGRDYLWNPGWNDAVCEAGKSHVPPGVRCTCGLYACTDLPALLRSIGPAQVDDQALVGVVGTGGLEIYERGWRAQSARIVAISAEHISRLVKRPDGSVMRVMTRRAGEHELLRLVARRYGVPLVSLSELEAIVDLAKKER